jgi:hypothetical protein
MACKDVDGVAPVEEAGDLIEDECFRDDRKPIDKHGNAHQIRRPGG